MIVMQRICVLWAFLWAVLVCGLAWTLLILQAGASAPGYVLRASEEGDFDHAVDNIGNSAGLVADWVARTRRRRPHPPAAGCSGGNPDHQPRDWTSGSLRLKSYEAQ